MILLVALLTLWPILGLIENVTGQHVKTQPVYYVKENEKDVVCASKVCVGKCCPQGQYLLCDNQTFLCDCNATNVNIDFSTVQVYSDKEYGVKVDTKFNDAFVILQSFLPNASDKFRNEAITSLLLKPYSRSFIGTDGKIQLENLNAYDRWYIFETGSYCIDLIDDKQLIYDNLILLPATPSSDNKLYMYAMFVSSFFLMLVLVVYAILPELRNLPGKILMAYVISQIMAFFSLCMIQVMTSLPPLSCEILTSFIYFSFLSSFCWLNVMSYDIFWTFRSYAKAREHRRGENFKFMMYCIYAWGLPLATTIMMIMMHKAELSHKPWIIKPLIGSRGCFLMDGQKFVYLYVPMLILIVCNWVFFLLTVFNIWRVSRATAVVRSSASGNTAAHRAHKLRFVLYIKLSVIMGVNWLLEVIGSFYPELHGWWVADMYNLLVGFSIFMIFVFRRKIYKDLQSKFSSVRLSRRSTTNSTINSSINSTTDACLSQDISMVSKHPRGSSRDRNSDRSV